MSKLQISMKSVDEAMRGASRAVTQAVSAAAGEEASAASKLDITQYLAEPPSGFALEENRHRLALEVIERAGGSTVSVAEVKKRLADTFETVGKFAGDDGLLSGAEKAEALHATQGDPMVKWMIGSAEVIEETQAVLNRIMLRECDL